MSQTLLHGRAESAEPEFTGRRRPAAGAGARGPARGRRCGVDRAGLEWHVRAARMEPGRAYRRHSAQWLGSAILVMRPARGSHALENRRPSGASGARRLLVHSRPRAGRRCAAGGWSTQQLCARRCGGIPVHRRRDRNHSDFADGAPRRRVAASLETAVWRAHPQVDGVPGRTDGS